MNALLKEGSPKTPEVNFNPSSGKLLLSGKSIPENSIEFYKPVLDWLDEYALQPGESIELKIQLEYFNTSSSKCLLDIFRKLEALGRIHAGKVSITWVYEEADEDMMEAGEDYKSMIDLPFRLEKL